ncbi:alpha/beta hydrolase [Fibrella arboris]|uniref:alpha/beta hydrolase n=1 Tax=Fibrella arboris TaxID=3242486 RepID=UPI0035224BB0
MYKEEIVSLHAHDGMPIPAIYSFNDEYDTPGRAILLLHGLSSNKIGYLNFYSRLAESFCEKNIATLRIDLRGHGESQASPREFTISSQITDSIVALKWLVKKGISRVDLFGSSFGAFPCIKLASLCDGLIDKIFLLAPVLDYQKTFIDHTTPWGKEVFYNILERTLINGETIKISETFYIHSGIVAEMTIINIESHLLKLSNEIHIMHGDNDGMVSYDIAKEISEKSKNLEFHSFHNMEHGFTDKGDDDGISPRTQENFHRIVQIVTS